MNRNYNFPSVSSEWAKARETDMAVATAIHAISGENRFPDEVWATPTSAEMDHVRMAVEEYVAHGDFQYDPSGYRWGMETIRFETPADA